MTHTAIKQIKDTLLKRKRELEGTLVRLAGEHVYEEALPDPADQASAATLEELNISLENNERDEYTTILKALAMIEQGTYGVCVDCNQSISEKRLQLNPHATRCVACQEIFEERG